MTRYYSLNQTADILGVSPRTVRRLITAGQLRAYRLGARQIRIVADDVESVLRRIPVTPAS